MATPTVARRWRCAPEPATSPAHQPGPNSCDVRTNPFCPRTRFSRAIHTHAQTWSAMGYSPPTIALQHAAGHLQRRCPVTIGERIAGAWSVLRGNNGRQPEQKGSIAPFDRIFDGAVGTDNNQLKEPYAKSTWVMRAIKLVTLPMVEVPLRFTVGERGGKQVVTDPQLLDWWEAPGIGADGQPISLADFFEATVGW